MDPILKNIYLCQENNTPIEEEFEELDIFKADIYSLGLTFYEILTDEKAKKVNESE